jgi:hypothetical protein
VIKSTPTGFVMHLRCQVCNNTYVLNVLNPGNGMVGTQRTPLNLDLETDAEITEFAGREPISRNDALDVYNVLSKGLKQADLRKVLDQ